MNALQSLIKTRQRLGLKHFLYNLRKVHAKRGRTFNEQVTRFYATQHWISLRGMLR